MIKQNQRREGAVAYFRTSSAANVGDEKDSLKRQRSAVNAFANRNRYQIVGEFYDAAVSGADAIEDRPGFAALLDRIENNGVRTVIVEDVSRFAREMKAHVLGIALLRERGVKLLSASDGQNLTEDTDEMTEGMVTIMAVFAQIEKKRLVKKLRAARDRKSSLQGRRIEGRKGYSQTRPELKKAAKEELNSRQSQTEVFAASDFSSARGHGLHDQQRHGAHSDLGQSSFRDVIVR